MFNSLITKTTQVMKSRNFLVSLNIFRKTGMMLFALLFTTILLQSCSKDEVNPLESTKYKTLNTEMRKLWSDHMHWTLATVDAFFNEPAQVESKLNRLLKNQQDIGASIVPYYGKEAGDALAKLLTEHIQGAVPVLTAAKNGDSTALNTALAPWYANASEIAQFLSKPNP